MEAQLRAKSVHLQPQPGVNDNTNFNTASQLNKSNTDEHKQPEHLTQSNVENLE